MQASEASGQKEQPAAAQTPETAGQKNSTRCTIWANPPAPEEKKLGDGKAPNEQQTLGYRPFQEVVLLEAHDTATQEIRERISQEHVYFALKFSIIGAILIVLFRLTRHGNIDEFLQMRRAALFFSAALLACAIVDTRLRFNALVMETLGEWLKNRFDPCMASALEARGVRLEGFEFWEKYFDNAERSPVMATLRYFSLSLTALYFLDRSLATTLQRFSIRLKHLEDKAKLVRDEYLIAKRGGNGVPSAASLEHELKQCWEEASQLASAMRKLIRRWNAWRKKMRVNSSLDLQEVRKVITHSPFFNDGQSSKTTMVAFESLSFPNLGEATASATSSPSGKRIIHLPASSLVSSLCRLICYVKACGQRILRRAQRGRRKTGDTAKAVPCPDGAPSLTGTTGAGASSPEPDVSATTKCVSSPQSETPRTPRPLQAPSAAPPPEELQDLEEYLWNLYLLERNRRHSVAQRHVGYQTGRSWWQ